MSWVLICRECAKGREIKTIGLLRRPPAACAACGAELPVQANGHVGGNPVDSSEIEDVRRKAAERRG